MDFIKANNTCLGIDFAGVELYCMAARCGGKSNLINELFDSISISMVESKLMKSKSKQSRMVKVKIGE
jgi:hypothetical protein